MTTMKRWTCPKCAEGKLAPGRARRDDARTYCLACSEKTGRLVRRTCVARETAAEKREAARKEKAKQKRASAAAAKERAKVARAAREKATASTYGGDLRIAAPVMWRALLSVIQENGGTPAQREIPEVSLHRRGRGGGLSYGHRDRITVSMRFSSLGRALEVLLHELTHKAVGNRHWHGPVFNRALHDAAEKLWPDVGVPGVWMPRGYKLSRAIEHALEKRIVEQGPNSVLKPFGMSIDERTSGPEIQGTDPSNGDCPPPIANAASSTR